MWNEYRLSGHLYHGSSAAEIIQLQDASGSASGTRASHRHDGLPTDRLRLTVDFVLVLSSAESSMQSGGCWRISSTRHSKRAAYSIRDDCLRSQYVFSSRT